MGKSIVTILIVCLMLTSCGIQKEESLTFVYDTEQYQTYKRLERLAASSADDSKVLYRQDISEVVETTSLEVERLKKVLVNETEIFQINNGNIELIAYCDDEEMYSDATQDRYTHLLINGEDFVLNTFGKPFYLREAVPPRIIWHDWNNDGIEDFIFWGENDRAGCLQYAFASTKDGQFYNLGSVSWEKDEGLCSYQRFPYMVTLLDDYMVKIDLESANISEIYDIKNSKFLEHCAIPLGMYDEEGKVTEIGRCWDFAAAGLYENDIKCSVSDDGSLTMSIISYIGVGYSTYNLDCGFVFNWKLGEDGYELIGIDSHFDIYSE